MLVLWDNIHLRTSPTLIYMKDLVQYTMKTYMHDIDIFYLLGSMFVDIIRVNTENFDKKKPVGTMTLYIKKSNKININMNENSTKLYNHHC